MAGVRPAAGSIAPHGLRYLALGDSYTIGEGVADSERWPVQLARALRADGLGVDDPQIIATTGWTTDELQAAIDRAAPTPGFDLVTLLIGVNNQYRGRPLDEYLRQFQGLLEHAIALAGGRARRVVVLSIPDWGVTPFAVASGRDVAQIAAQIDAFNREARLACLGTWRSWMSPPSVASRGPKLRCWSTTACILRARCIGCGCSARFPPPGMR